MQVEGSVGGGVLEARGGGRNFRTNDLEASLTGKRGVTARSKKPVRSEAPAQHPTKKSN